jgi:hypothetical protein
MKRSGTVKFPNSVQLFKFCQKVLAAKKGEKIRDQEIGSILDFNPSDCSHWKRGEKNVRSVFSLASLATALEVEVGLIHDLAYGAIDLDEAYFEYVESNQFKSTFGTMASMDMVELAGLRERIGQFVDRLIAECDFNTPPLYLPEVIRTFSFVSSQPSEMIDRLSRILRVKAGTYLIHFKKGELKAQTRMSMVKDLARIIFEGERERFPELGKVGSEFSVVEQTLFTANLLLPKAMLAREMGKLDTRKNMIAELASLFWVPKSLVSFQIQEMLRESRDMTAAASQPEISSAGVSASF